MIHFSLVSKIPMIFHVFQGLKQGANFEKPTCAPQLPSGSDAKVVTHHLSPGEAEHFPHMASVTRLARNKDVSLHSFLVCFFEVLFLLAQNIILKLVWYFSAILQLVVGLVVVFFCFFLTNHTPLEPPSREICASPGNQRQGGHSGSQAS